ncbi:MAG: hypothetical protein V9G24_12905 [Rhodoblastus sp.]
MAFSPLSAPTAWARCSSSSGDDEVAETGGIDGEPVDDEAIERILKNLARAPLGLARDDEFRDFDRRRAGENRPPPPQRSMAEAAWDNPYDAHIEAADR